MRTLSHFAACAALLLCSCSERHPDVALGRDDPGNPQAATAPLSPASTTLAPNAWPAAPAMMNAPRPAEAAPAPAMDHSMHGAMPGRMGDATPSTRPGERTP